jgi:hypothetical protein
MNISKNYGSMKIDSFQSVCIVKIVRGHSKNRGIAMYLITMLLLSVVLLGLNKLLVSMVVYGDKGNDSNNIKNHSLINDISDQIVNSNISADKEQVQQVLQIIQTQIALTSSQDKATNAINQISTNYSIKP